MKHVLAIALALIVASAQAQTNPNPSRTYGAWTAGLTNGSEFLYAGTANDSGTFLAKYCDVDKSGCFWILGDDVPCNDGVTAPIVANGPEGAMALEIVCKAFGKATLRILTPYDEVERLIGKTGYGVVSMAVPVQSGKFTVFRFNLHVGDLAHTLVVGPPGVL